MVVVLMKVVVKTATSKIQTIEAKEIALVDLIVKSVLLIIL